MVMLDISPIRPVQSPLRQPRRGVPRRLQHTPQPPRRDRNGGQRRPHSRPAPSPPEAALIEGFSLDAPLLSGDLELDIAILERGR
ncbi:MAG: hypothetical protein QGH76_07370 [Phycisphaerales bacterium]|jgi:hypothetical protein|nr:hypothetical protein [Phycisphaerales bacterium]